MSWTNRITGTLKNLLSTILSPSATVVFTKDENGNVVKSTPTSTPTLTPTATPTPDLSGFVSPLASDYNGQVLNQGPTATPTPYPTPITAGNYEYIPQPTITPHPEAKSWPYADLAKKYFPDVDPQIIQNIVFKESSNLPRRYHINYPEWKAGTFEGTREEWKALREKYPYKGQGTGIDVGATQINTVPAMTDYLEKQGLTYWDILQEPEAAFKVAADMYYGRIRGIPKGLQNWVAAVNQGLVGKTK